MAVLSLQGCSKVRGRVAGAWRFVRQGLGPGGHCHVRRSVRAGHFQPGGDEATGSG